MVYVRDDGVFDAPIEKVWKYVQDAGNHVHESILSQKVLETKGNVVKLRVETVNARGGKEEQVWKMTMDPPFGHELEVLEGSTKGTKQAHVYVPMGNKTKVIVVGDFHVSGLDDETVRKGAIANFAKVFDEDTRNMRNLK